MDRNIIWPITKWPIIKNFSSNFKDNVIFHLNKLLSLPPTNDDKLTADEQMARDFYFSKYKLF